ncbi:MAG: hypothetical protein K2W33_10715, partial [Burkholderiales bacterium]|nr:hypothetical protein [Burkholderiales bacterium]
DAHGNNCLPAEKPRPATLLGVCLYFAALQQKTLAPIGRYPILHPMLQCSKSKKPMRSPQQIFQFTLLEYHHVDC